MAARIALFMADFSGGGSERVMVNIANGLTRRGHIVDLLVARREGPYSQAVSNDICVRTLSGRLISAIPSLARYMRENRPAAILVAGEHATIIAVAAMWLSRCPLHMVTSVHNSIERDGSAPNRAKDWASPALMRLFYPAVDKIVAVSEELRQEALRVLGGEPDRFVTIYNPLYTDGLVERSKAHVFHRWLERKEFPVVIAVGRLVEQKGFDTLLRAFAMVRKSRNARLLILGEGPEQDNLNSLAIELGISDSIEFLGFVENPYVYMAQSDVLAMTSRWEGFGNVLVEAMACGTQVVSTDCSFGPREILDNGLYGTLVPVGDARSMADAVLRSLQYPIQASLLVERARAFSVEIGLDQYEAVLGIRENNAMRNSDETIEIKESFAS